MTKKDFLPTYDAEELELMRELTQGERTPIKDLTSEKEICSLCQKYNRKSKQEKSNQH